jgi:ubiquinone/menaquinone biosynthesis C-methylase UbiE
VPVPDGFHQADDISNKDAVDSWDKAAEEFAAFFADGTEFYHKHIINPSVMALLGDIEGKTILDLACGEGHVARALAEATGKNVTVLGVDASESMIRIAREKSQEYRDCLAFRQVDACDLAGIEDDSFDVAICNMALMDIRNYRQAISEVSRTLRAKGVFVFSILHPCFFTPRSDWLKDGDGNIIGWKVDGYHLNQAWKWTVKSRMTAQTYHFHRTLEDYVSVLRECGFVTTDVREPIPSEELCETHPRLVRELRRGGFLVVRSVSLGGLL